MTEEERQAELQRLIDEQRADDTHIVRPDRAMRYGWALDAEYDGPDGKDSFANHIGVDEDGEIVCFLRESKGSILNGGAAWHGTEDGYTNHLCRCAKCRAANSRGNLRRKRARAERGCPEHLHGTEAGYGNYMCRCDRCRKAHQEKNRERRDRTLGAIEPRECKNPDCGETFRPERRGVQYCGRQCSLRMQARKRKQERQFRAAA